MNVKSPIILSTNNEGIKIEHETSGNFAYVSCNASQLRFNADPTGAIASSEIVHLVDNTEVIKFSGTECVVNELGNDYDFRVESTQSNGSLFVEGSTGYVGIGVNPPLDPLHVKGVSGSALLRLEDDGGRYSRIFQSNTQLQISVDPDDVVASSDIIFLVDGSEKVRIHDNGYMGINDAVPDSALSIVGDDQTSSTITTKRYSNNEAPAYLDVMKARGTIETPLALQSGDDLFKVWGRGYTGTGFAARLELLGETTEAWDGSNQGSQFVIRATPIGGTLMTEVFSVDGDGKAVIGSKTKTTNEGDLYLNNSGVLAMDETTTPTPDANIGKTYWKADNRYYGQDGAGVEHLLGGSGIGAVGEMYQNDNATATTINTVNVWEHVVNFSEGVTETITFASNALTVASTGNYLLMGSISSQSAFVNKDIEFAISIDDAISTKTISKRRYGNTGTGSQSISAILSLTANEAIKLEVRNLTDANDITIIDANISLHFI